MPNHAHRSKAVGGSEMTITPDRIEFYRASEVPFGCFSNFSLHPIVINSRLFPTTEHYFQSMKFAHSPSDFEEVAAASEARQAASMGRQRNRPLRPDWETVKDRIMYEAVLAKFTQHKDLASVLLSTGNATIVEHTNNDSYWADGGDGTGKNMLGVTLMQVRKVLKDSAVPGPATPAAPS